MQTIGVASRLTAKKQTTTHKMKKIKRLAPNDTVQVVF